MITKHISLNNGIMDMSTSLWKEDLRCLEWPDQRHPTSVIYMKYGSITVMSARHLEEFSWGLVNSEHPFLSVITPDLLNEDFTLQLAHTLTHCEWGIGVEVSHEVKREEIKELMKEIMGGEKGRAIRRNVRDWKTKVEEATHDAGSSYNTFDRQIQKLSHLEE
ncbi:Linamarin synthase 2-like protein [Drosera capensis]